MDTHEHEDSNNKKVEEEDFFADCENDMNGFSQNNNIVVSTTSAANEAKVKYMHVCFLFCMFFFSFFFVISTKRKQLTKIHSQELHTTIRIISIHNSHIYNC